MAPRLVFSDCKRSRGPFHEFMSRLDLLFWAFPGNILHIFFLQFLSGWLFFLSVYGHTLYILDSSPLSPKYVGNMFFQSIILLTYIIKKKIRENRIICQKEIRYRFNVNVTKEKKKMEIEIEVMKNVKGLERNRKAVWKIKGIAAR